MLAQIVKLVVGLLLTGLIHCHLDEFDMEFTERDPENRFRILRDDYDINDALEETADATRRRLTSEYWNMIKEEVTHEKLAQIIHQHTNYRNASPFPHMETMDIFPKAVTDAINKEIPDNPRPAREKGCVVGGTCYNSKIDEKSKNAFHSESQYGPATLAVFTFMQSSLFTKFLEKLTGIDGILADSEYKGAGIHQTLSEGFLNVHADFNLDRQRNVHRRVNVFLYVNPDWQDSYGGHLELWSRDLKPCEKKISPDLGKLVVFSTTDFSYHWHQQMLACPADRSRRSLAMYYYSKTRPNYECIKNNCFAFHSTLFQKTACKTCHAQECYQPDAYTVSKFPVTQAYF